MDYELNASDLMAKIQKECLQTFLTSVRYETSTAGSTCISSLDAHLSASNFKRTSYDWPLNRGDVVEIQGSAASGKTQFLSHMLLTCLMPHQHKGSHLGGWNKAAVLVDADGKFSASRLRQLLVSRLSRLSGGEGSTHDLSAAEDEQELATRCLENLHVFRPTSSAQLAITLMHLPNYHATNPRLQDTEIGLLAIDSLSAYYWRDRYSLEQLRDTIDSSSATMTSNPLYYVVKALQEFRASHRPVILLSNWGLNAVSSGLGEPESPFFRQHLHPFPAPFEARGAVDAISNIQNSQQQHSSSVDSSRDSPARPQVDSNRLPLHYHITLQPVCVNPFTTSCTQEPMRAVHGKIRGLLRTPGSSDVREFTFRIGDREILVDEPDRPS